MSSHTTVYGAGQYGAASAPGGKAAYGGPAGYGAGASAGGYGGSGAGTAGQSAGNTGVPYVASPAPAAAPTYGQARCCGGNPKP